MPNDEYREQFLFQGDPKERRVEGIVEVWRDGKRLGHFSTMHRQPALPIKAYGEREEMGWDIPTCWAIDADNNVWMDNAHGHPMQLIDANTSEADALLDRYVFGGVKEREYAEEKRLRDIEMLGPRLMDLMTELRSLRKMKLSIHKVLDLLESGNVETAKAHLRLALQ